jgi:hypothetical protein
MGEAPQARKETIDVTFDELQALDGAALVEGILAHPQTEDAVYACLDRLAAEPALAALLRSKAPSWFLSTVDLWLGRRKLAFAGTTIDELCALATARARLRDADFPEVSAKDLVWQRSGYCATGAFLERDGGERGWTVDVEERDVGPAEVIHESEWRIRLRGRGWKLLIAYDATGSLLPKTWEESDG